MPIMNYSTKIDVFQTLGEIQAMLVRHGAKKVLQEFDDDEGLRYCFHFDSDDERFIREYGELYSYHFGARWFLDKDKATIRLEKMKKEAE